MSTLKNHVQLIGNVGQETAITNLDSGKKVAHRRSLGQDCGNHRKICRQRKGDRGNRET